MMQIENDCPQTSFWQEIGKTLIVIPKIQRDYAQGRDDVHATEIRNKILNKFIYTVIHRTSIDLDFIYGTNIGNEFIPLDGQQRLTTLFLLHWYIAKRAKISASELLHLKNFRYKTRLSSTAFCIAIVDSHFPFEQITDLKEFILDQRWFYFEWKKDPTISAMLNTLKDIHDKFSEINPEITGYEQLWNNLTNDNLITFKKLPINKIGLNDDLYIKMNSRGKPLSTFENFKVWFETKYPQNIEWQDKIDNEWTNLFWKLRNVFKGTEYRDDSMDDEFMQFLNGMLIFNNALNNYKQDVQFIYDNTNIQLSQYEDKLNSFQENDVILITNTLDWLSKHEERLQIIQQSNKFWTDKPLLKTFISNKPTWAERTRFYAIVHYINQSNESTEKNDNLVSWLRIARNLIENTVIDNADNFISSVKAIASIGKGCTNIYEYLQENDISFFRRTQVEEEKLKLKLFNLDLGWIKPINDAENHILFRGCIGFLLPLDINENLNVFNVHCEVAKELYADNGSIAELKKDYILMRATLSKCNCTGNIRLIDNLENWRELLKRPDFSNALYLVLTELIGKNHSEYFEALNNIIEEYSDKSILWKYYLVKNRILLDSEASRSKYIKLYGNDYYLFNNEGGNWINNDNQFLLSNIRNKIITQFRYYSNEFLLHLDSDWWIICDDKIKEIFYRGQHIWIRKSMGSYNLWFQFKQNDLVIGFHNDEKEFIQIIDNPFPLIDNWLVAKPPIPYPMNEGDISSWINGIVSDFPMIEGLVQPKVG
jgi:hypothetical protein